MTDLVHVHAQRLVDYLDGDTNSPRPGDTVLAFRPYLRAIVDDLRRALTAAEARSGSGSLNLDALHEHDAAPWRHELVDGTPARKARGDHYDPMAGGWDTPGHRGVVITTESDDHG